MKKIQLSAVLEPADAGCSLRFAPCLAPAERLVALGFLREAIKGLAVGGSHGDGIGTFPLIVDFDILVRILFNILTELFLIFHFLE